VGAEGHIPWGLLHIDAEFGFKPLAVFVDKADQSNGRAADVGSQPHEFVKAVLRSGVQNLILPQGSQPLLFVGREGGLRHRSN
jgi:hypothetical protein